MPAQMGTMQPLTPAFGGLNGNTPWYNIAGGMTMLVGRFFMILPMLAIAGNLAKKKYVPPSLGTFPVTTPLFSVLLTLAWETGHRLSAILELRWKDVMFDKSEHAPHGSIHWYADSPVTKKRHPHRVATYVFFATLSSPRERCR